VVPQIALYIMAIKPLTIQIQRTDSLLSIHPHLPLVQSADPGLPVPTPIFIPILNPTALQNPYHPSQNLARSPTVLRVDRFSIFTHARKVFSRPAESVERQLVEFQGTSNLGLQRPPETASDARHVLDARYQSKDTT
jgi:hypothetical protein